MSTWSHPDDADMARAYVVVGGRILECEADDFLEGREFYELMQAYRHDAVGDAAQFEKVKAWLRAQVEREILERNQSLKHEAPPDGAKGPM